MRLVGLVIYILCNSFYAEGQTVDSTLYEVEELPLLDTLRETLADYYRQQAVYEIETYTYVEKWKWLQYAPSFGWNFVQNTPYIGWNSRELFQAINAKRAKKAQIQSIIHRINLNYEKNCKLLALKIKLYESKKTAYLQDLELLKLEQELMELYDSQYKRREITPSVYLTKRISFANIVSQLTTHRFQLDRMRMEILGLAFFGDRITLLSTSDVTGD